MERREGAGTNQLTNWHAYPSVQRWSSGLLQVTGLTHAEVARRVETLFQFCVQQEIDPEIMAEECRSSKDRVARRAFYLEKAGRSAAKLIVQSFLVHNGVNVFGDIVCMPSTREQVASEQGSRWLRDGAPSTGPSLDDTPKNSSKNSSLNKESAL